MPVVHRKNHIMALAAIGSAMAFVLADGAEALTTNAPFNVTATISNSCTVVASGNIGPLTEVTHSGSNTVTITCNNGTGWTVDFAGSNDTAGQATLPYHYMKDSGTNYIEYVLTGTGSGWTFSDGSNRLAHDGNNPPTTFMATGTGSGTGQAATITATATSGAVPYSITTAPTGSYSDTVTVTVTF
ncbi:MAG: spore coat protein U domain-containing protein [Methylocystis sp.]|uniref:spore coat protein U domain-containing protein n=1 Tax=Methylocystis sp. TaxID=1911079 RepID=UPI003DA588ED